MEDELSFLVEEQSKAYNIRHRCFHFAKDVVLFVNESKYEKIHFSIFDQLLRSATSIGANLVEGTAGSSKRDFINFRLYRLSRPTKLNTGFALSGILYRQT